ncbi:MAG: hypothetical protein KBT30_01740, partial [Clostridiales bacterium]|nr:hypothetical protein [Candidatus Apopatousia equi]
LKGFELKKNIAIISLVSDYKKQISKALADELEMIFADVNDLMEFNLINDDMLESAGQEYYDKNEKKTLQTITTYDNTVLTLNFSTLNKNNNSELLKESSLVIYLRLNYDLFKQINKVEATKSLTTINEIAFEDRDKLMKKYADIIVDINNLDKKESVETIISSINNFYKV